MFNGSLIRCITLQSDNIDPLPRDSFLQSFDLYSTVRAKINQSIVVIQRAEDALRFIYMCDTSMNRSSVCDGIIDCHHAIDEQCRERNPMFTCSIDEYACPLTHRCIPHQWKCNGRNDCQDIYASDELSKQCPQ